MYPVWLLVGVVWRSGKEGIVPVVEEVLVTVKCERSYVPLALSRNIHPWPYRRAELLLVAVNQELGGLHRLRKRVCRLSDIR